MAWSVVVCEHCGREVSRRKIRCMKDRVSEVLCSNCDELLSQPQIVLAIVESN